MAASEADAPHRELDRLNTIISEFREGRQRIWGWSVTVNAALAFAFLSDDLAISRYGYLGVSLAVIAAFIVMDAARRISELRAIRRSNEVEQQLREGARYDGPAIGVALGGPLTSIEVRDAIVRSNEGMVFHLVMAVLAIALACVG